jgi:lysophospholipase L1-like esterase
MYGPKASGTWPAGVSYKGANGTNGATWRTGSGAPSNTLGVDGDLYLDTVTSNVWQRASGTYSIIDNIKGAAGAAGATGPRGLATRMLGAGTGFYQGTNSQPILSDGVVTGANSIETRIVPLGGGDMVVTLSNRNGTGPVTYTASAQWPGGIVPEPFTFNGSNSVTVPAGQEVDSDPFNGASNVWTCPPPGTPVAIRTFLSCASGVKFEYNITSGGGMITGTSQVDETLSQSFNYGSSGVSQVGIGALKGTPLMQGISVAAIGDSIMRGEGSGLNGFGDTGPLYYACGGLTASALPWANCAVVGETGQMFATSATLRRQLYLKYADKIPVMYGTNDIGFNPSITLATLQATMLKVWWACNGYGAGVIGCTLLPRSTSTNSFTTVPGQTPVTGWGTGSTAALFNAWMRGGAPINSSGAPVAVGTPGAIVAGQAGHPLAAVCNWTAPVEAGQDSGLWIANGTANYATGDGTHPSDAAAQLMGAVLATYLSGEGNATQRREVGQGAQREHQARD